MDKLITQLLSILETALGTTFKTYQWGDPKVILRGDDALPGIFVIPESTSFNGSGTVRDTVIHTVTVRVVIDLKNYLKQTSSSSDNTLDSVKALTTFVEGVDTNGEFNVTCIYDVIRRNTTIDGFTLYSNNFNIDYGDIVFEDKDTLLKKADLTMEFHKRPIRPT